MALLFLVALLVISVQSSDVKDGTCPPLESLAERECPTNVTAECETDANCEGPYKCCSNGCYHTCTRPLYTGCQQVRMLNERRAQLQGRAGRTFVPRCGPQGEFDPVQCDPQDGRCWCVDRMGLEVAGTRARSLELVNCSARSKCAGYLCRMLCPYGFELDDSGCPLCECRNPCKGVECPGGQECSLEEQLECAEGPCPPIPTCKRPRSLESFCPRGDPLLSPDSGRPLLCGYGPSKPQCPAKFQCQVQSGNDYGVCCPLADKPGVCPHVATTVEQCGRACTIDLDCNGQDKCCETQQCGTTCLPPANTTLCQQQKALAHLLSGASAPGYVPQCDEQGNFIRKQCSSNGKVCWCVEDDGRQRSGTLGPADAVDCQSNNAESRQHDCDLIFCNLHCEYGYKVGSDGCQQCKCWDPCEAVNCSKNSVCVIVREEPCVSGDCPPIATCHKKQPSACVNGSPLLQEGSDKTVKCTGQDCPGGYDCEILPGDHSGVCCPRDASEPESKKLEACTAVVGKCEDLKRCTKNTDCGSDSQCCHSAECGSVCSKKTDDLPRTMCQFLQTQHDLAIPVPKCRPDGSYEPVQCHGGECWCVDEFGVEITGSRSSAGRGADCRQVRASKGCLGLTCRLGCDYGFESDEEGCPICSCRNPCADAQCPEGEVCQMDELICADQWCPSVPKCIPKGSARSLWSICPSGNLPFLQEGEDPVLCDTASPSESCPSNHMCTPVTNDTAVCCPMPVETTRTPQHEKEGSCPAATTWETGACVDECSTDGDCSGPQKCCRSSCGAYVCRDPSGDLGKPGQCPYLTPSSGPSCDNKCGSDYNCPSAEKCCSNGCGSQCMRPLYLTACQHQRIVAEHRAREAGAIWNGLPQCDNEYGSFQEVQCSTQEGTCWCVDKHGIELPGTRGFGPPTNCSSPRDSRCSPQPCDMECEFGFKVGQDGCTTCKCNDPCEGVVCMDPKEECTLAKVNCITEPCPPLALCRPRVENPCPFGEPMTDPEGSTLHCGPFGRQCPSSHRCHLGVLGEFAVCCPKPRSVCYEEARPGPCSSAVSRWYFNGETNTCQEFKYGGCDGNFNNFESKEECEAVCPVMTPCEKVRERSLKIAKTSKKPTFLPKCNSKTGVWEPIQCLDPLGMCWCVTEAGEQVSGTLVRGTPYCTKRGGRTVGDTSICPGGETAYLCPDDICENKVCMAYANATCRVDPCGGCKARFYDHNNQPVDCGKGLTACHGEMQDVLNSRPWSNQGIQIDHLQELASALRDLSIQPGHHREARSLGRLSDHMFPSVAMTSHHIAILVVPRVSAYSVTGRSGILEMAMEPLLPRMESTRHYVRTAKCPAPSMLQMIMSLAEGCHEECASNEDCPSHSYCCQNGCGTTCVASSMQTLDARQGMVFNKPGACPPQSASGQRCLFVRDMCQDDRHCPGAMKCCLSACGATCADPAGSPPLVAASMVVAPPICSPDGGYVVSQSQGQLSWCVNKYGEPQDGTLTRGHVRCDINGTILHREQLGPVCQNPNVTPRICRHECREARCFQHPNAMCVADPCDNCRVHFFNEDGDEVSCRAKCSQPIETGNCRSALPHYAYNASARQCQLFMYGGCGGNDNNFSTMEECQQECETSAPLCSMPYDSGPCDGKQKRYFYNQHTMQCEAFQYGGCGGNANNFETRAACEARCPDQVMCPWSHVNDQELDVCDRSKACQNVSCAPGAICTADPCDCAPKFIDQSGHPVACHPPVSVETTSTEASSTESQESVEVDPATRCLAQRHKGKQVECDPDGAFVPRQCSPSHTDCWCVNEAGTRLPGTWGNVHCRPVNVDRVDVNLVLKPRTTETVRGTKSSIRRSLKRMLRSLKVQPTEGKVKVKLGPTMASCMFTLTKDDKMKTAFMLEKMVDRDQLLVTVGKETLHADPSETRFEYVSTYIPPLPAIEDNVLAVAQHKAAWDTTALVALCSALVLALLLVAAFLIHKRRRKDVDLQDPKLTLVTLTSPFYQYVTNKIKPDKPKDEKAIPIPTVTSKVEALEKEGVPEENVVVDLPPAYEDIDKKGDSGV
uniref:Uncharacterized protein n=1 Tax=Ornithodoros turicata TaxID=34597 RepID=A0A2R5L5B6_9ACAR